MVLELGKSGTKNINIIINNKTEKISKVSRIGAISTFVPDAVRTRHNAPNRPQGIVGSQKVQNRQFQNKIY